MGTIGAIAGIVNTGLSMIEKYVDDPKRRLAARQDYIDSLKKQVGEILNENAQGEELDKAILDFITVVHTL